MCPVDDLSASKKDSLRAKVVLIRAANVVMTLPGYKELSFFMAGRGRAWAHVARKQNRPLKNAVTSAVANRNEQGRH